LGAEWRNVRLLLRFRFRSIEIVVKLFM
jgi:hypothetical protein